MQAEQALYKVSENVVEHSLENGLKVLIKPVPSSTTASVWVFYRVGSRNERPGTTGSSHWCEHMLFKGGGKLAKGDVFRLISREGGKNNAFTDRDMTAYYETLPKDKLELGLFIESERMAHSAFEPSEVESERQVIISEREGAENSPIYQVREELFATAFRVHPYRWPVVGWKSDLKTMTREDLFQHYRRFYHPNNAILVLAGNIDPNHALGRVKEYFSNIEAGEPAGKLKMEGEEEPESCGERISTISKPGVLNYLSLGYRLPMTTHQDTPALIVLSAVLGGWQGMTGYFGDRFIPKSNRLYRALVEHKIASEVNTYFPISLDPSMLHFELTIMPGSTIQAAREALVLEVEKIRDSPPSEEEMRIALNQIRSWHAYENDGTTSQAFTLGMMEVIDRKSLADTLIERCLQVTPDQVQRVAKSHLGNRNRIICIYDVNSSSGS